MKKRLFVCTVLVIISMLLVPAGSVLAQDQRPPKPPHPVNQSGGSLGPYGRIQTENDITPPVGEVSASAMEIPGLLQDKDGRWYNDGSAEEQGVSAEADISALAVADTFGYTYKSVPYRWIDATGGTMMEDTYQYIDLPFDFPFYGQGYSVITVSQYGHLIIGDYSWTRGQSPMVEPSEPNNVVAPYWTWLYPNTSYTDDGGVYMDTGEDATGQYVVLEWYNMTDWLGDTEYDDYNNFSFEAILYEDGRIIYQYDDIYHPWGSWYCGSAGIEDWTGTIGRATVKFCKLPKSYRGVQFAPPTVPAARVKVFPLDYGALAAPGTEAEVVFTVHNNGTLDDDAYDLTIKSKWPVTLFGEDDMSEFQPLEDTDGDKKLDTGWLCVGCSRNILVKTLVPMTAVPGNSLSSTITVASSLKTSRKVTVNIQTTVPAAFTQSYQADWENQVKYFSPANGIITTETNTDSWWGNNSAVTTLPNGNTVSLWSDYYCDEDGNCPYEEVYYRVNDSQGAFVAGNAKVQDLTGQTDVWDFNAALAAAPDGSTGITWVHEVSNLDENENTVYNYNIYFAALNAAGEISYGPANITNNEEYYSYDTRRGKIFYIPHIAATADNRFMLAWRQYEYVGGLPQDNIYTAILNTTGGVIQGVTERTLDRGDVNGNDYDDSGYYEASVTGLTNNRFLLSWGGWEAKKWQRTYKLYYQVIGSNGIPVTPQASISTGLYSNTNLDAAQMSGGQIILAWSHGTKVAWNSKPSLYYIVLNDLTYKKAKGPVALTHKAALTGSGSVSVTTDNLNHAILTWVDSNPAFGKHMYYALLGKNGTVLTKPAVMLSNFDRWQGEISVNYYGYGNSPYPVSPDR